MATHAAILSEKELKQDETQRQYDEALQRERANRKRQVDIQKEELHCAIMTTERNNDRAWEKVCGTLQSQLGELQTQVAQYQINRERQVKCWEAKEQSF